MHRSLHPRADVDRLYVLRKKGRRGLLSIEDSINKEENSIAHYVENTQEPILRLTKEIMLNTSPEQKETFAVGIDKERINKWNQMKLHGVWPKKLEKQSPKSNLWLQKSNLKPATEALITAAEDQVQR